MWRQGTFWLDDACFKTGVSNLKGLAGRMNIKILNYELKSIYLEKYAK